MSVDLSEQACGVRAASLGGSDRTYLCADTWTGQLGAADGRPSGQGKTQLVVQIVFGPGSLRPSHAAPAGEDPRCALSRWRLSSEKLGQGRGLRGFAFHADD